MLEKFLMLLERAVTALETIASELMQIADAAGDLRPPRGQGEEE